MTRPLASAFALLTLLTVTLAAQNNNRWAQPYQNGMKAFREGNYQMAITLFERAVAVDSKQQAGKYVEGVFRVDYFPYFYLGASYLELKNYAKAKENFDQADVGLPRPLRLRLDDYKKQLPGDGGGIARGGQAPPVQQPPLRGRPAPGPAAPAVNAAFEPAVRAAETAMTGRRFSDAVASFDAARAADAAEFARQNLQARRDDAARGVAWQQLVDEGRQLLQRAQLSAARAKFQQADQTWPGQPGTTDGLNEVRQRSENYERLKAAAEQDVRANAFKNALDKYAQARSVDVDQAAADNLAARVRSIEARMNAVPAATPAPALRSPATPTPSAAAPAVPAAPVPDKGVDAPAPPVDRAGTSDDPNRAVLRDALSALLRGRADISITLLEPATSGRGAADRDAAALHAYLGVAYATQALSSVKQDEPAQALRDKALAEFRLAVQAQRDYQLSTRIVSPKILALFEQARSN